MRWLWPHSMLLVTVALVSAPVLWAFPAELPFWRSLSIIFGWAGCGLLLVSLLFMLREPRLAVWLGGLERMYVWHHRLGIFAYLTLLMHPLALAVGAWNESPALAWSTLAPWHETWPVWVGWASLLCMMLGLGIALSAQIPYATWRWLHSLLAVAVLLAFLHLLLLGLNYFLLWAPILAIVFLLWRLVRGDLGLAAKPYLVIRVEHLTDAMVEVTMRPMACAIEARPGQFVLVAFLDGPHFRGCKEYHPFTISGIGLAGEISLGIKALGDHTRHLQKLEIDVPVRVQGPFGDFLADCKAVPSTWIAGGVGITPFLAQLRNAKLVQPVRLIYLHRDEADAAYRDELKNLAERQPMLALEMLASGDSVPDLAAIFSNKAGLPDMEYFLCGPPGLIRSTVRILKQRGINPRKIHFEQFDFR